MKTQKFSFDIDVSGSCNLRCPCCPQGNIRDYRLSHGFMEPELLARIVRKAAAECLVTGVNLFNWTEPLLHPRLAELIRVVQDAGIPCHLSSNLNLLPDADAIMAANPASFKISLSGFTQEIYGITHRGGDIERVKKHMTELVEAKKRNNATSRIFVTYHRYRHNLKEEPLMRKFAADLGIDFEPAWALMFPLEKIIACVDGEAQDFPLTEEDQQLIDRLALPLKKALAIAQKNHSLSCRLRDSQISLDFQGNVMLCCGIFDAGKYTIGNYMDLPFEKIQMLRQNHSLCKICMHHGAHQYLTNRTSEMEELILETILPEDVGHLELRQEFAQERRQLRLQKIYRTLFSRVFTSKQKAALKIRVDRMLRIVDMAKRALFRKDL